MSAWFITGSDTGVGKTLIACALLRLCARLGRSAIGMKPVAAGLDPSGRNEDVEALCAAASLQAPRQSVNPYALRAAVAPHLAAREEGREIRFSPILDAFADLRRRADDVVVEGVGGFRVPLGPDGDSADLAGALALPVILVVGLRLGCINHALLSEEAILARGLKLAGWVANRIDPTMSHVDANIATLRERLSAPLLGSIPHLAPADPERAADLLQLPEGVKNSPPAQNWA
jgi:dethiobiotin synthetase